MAELRDVSRVLDRGTDHYGSGDPTKQVTIVSNAQRKRDGMGSFERPIRKRQRVIEVGGPGQETLLVLVSKLLRNKKAVTGRVEQSRGRRGGTRRSVWCWTKKG